MKIAIIVCFAIAVLLSVLAYAIKHSEANNLFELVRQVEAYEFVLGVAYAMYGASAILFVILILQKL